MIKISYKDINRTWLIIPFLLFALLFIQCKDQQTTEKGNKKIAREQPTPELVKTYSKDLEVPEGMVWIPGGEFTQGAVEGDKMAVNHEKPAHRVAVDGFFMDETEVTNAEFREFVDATGYKTVAEREIYWEDIKTQLPPGTPKPHDSLLQPGSLIFKKTKTSVPNLYDYSQWWEWKVGTSWKHPQGPGSSIEGKEDYPVVHIAYEDAVAYSEWAGKRLPTEAEWEYAAKGGLKNAIFSWGNDPNKLSENANTWEGEFPTENTQEDGYENKAPVKSYPPNNYGLYDIMGNVWEFTQDWYNTGYYEELESHGLAVNPQGPENPYNPNNPQIAEKIIKGGSFLCAASYCASFRPSARMANSLDSSQEHLGFRTVVTEEMLKQLKDEKSE